MKETTSVPINWESSGYSVLKNLNATILGVLCEFIDNSIQSYKNKKEEIKKYENDYKLKIEITKDNNDEWEIRDNAGGIDYENFQRALKPANRPDNTKGLNEFGLGMKYAAVWISNEWELVSTAIGEDVERTVIFNYKDVVTKNLYELPKKTRKVRKDEHYTIVRLRKLEKERVHGFKWATCEKKIASIYRNFIRPHNDFFSTWKEDEIDLIIDHKKVLWEEYGFLNAVPFSSKNKPVLGENEVEWKFKFDWQEMDMEEEGIIDNKVIKENTKIEVSGFVGILPNMIAGKHGFTLYRRGRMVEGIDNKIFPTEISGNQASSAQYRLLYGEIHFKNVDISFDKTKLTINRSLRNHIFQTISLMVKKFGPNRKYDLIRQTNNYRFGYKEEKAVDAIEKVLERTNKKSRTLDNELIEKNASKIKFSEQYDKITSEENKISLNNTLPDPVSTTKEIQGILYNVELHFSNSETNQKFYNLNHNFEEKKITITLNVKNKIVRRFYEDKKTSGQLLEYLCGLIICLSVSEISAELDRNKARDVRNFFNEYVGSIKQFNE